MFRCFKRKRKIGWPTLYKPEEVHNVSLFCLLRDSRFAAVLPPIRGQYGYDSDNPESESNRHINSGYRFTRSDEVKINYFKTIQDISDGKNAYLNLAEFLQAYRDNPAINRRDITVLPIVLVANGRSHFNTLLLRENAAGVLQITLIEPRSDTALNNARAAASVTSIKQTVKAVMGGATPLHYLQIGQQAFFDDYSCGAHHINYAEIISQLPTAVLDNPVELKKALSHARIDRRKQDGVKYEQVNALIGQGFYHSTPSITHYFTRFMLSIKGIFAKTGKVAERQDEEWRNSVTKLPVDAMRLLEEEMDKYMLSYPRAESKSATKHVLFCMPYQGHTRQNTVQAILEALAAIETKSSSDPEKRYEVGLLLYSFYFSIAENSRLRQSLETVLMHLLDCAPEAKALSSLEAKKELFYRRLSIVGAGLDSPLKNKEQYARARAINAMDEDVLAKFCRSRRETLNMQRGEKLSEMVQAIKPISVARAEL